MESHWTSVIGDVSTMTVETPNREDEPQSSGDVLIDGQAFELVLTMVRLDIGIWSVLI